MYESQNDYLRSTPDEWEPSDSILQKKICKMIEDTYPILRNFPKSERYGMTADIIDNNKGRLKEQGKRLEEFLNERLKLEFNRKTSMRPARCGVEFVGCVIHDDHTNLRKSTTLRMKRRLSQVEVQYNRGEITLDKALQTVASYEAMLKQVGMHRFKEHLWSNFVLTRGNLQEAKARPILYSEEYQ